MTSFSLRNFFSLSWTNSHFSEFRKVDDETNEIEKFNSEAEKIKADKLSIDELTKTQAKEQKITITFFSVSTSFFLTDKNDTDDWFSFARFSKVEETTNDATDSETKNRERVKVESQNSQSKWMFFDRANSTKKQTAHTNFSFKLSSNSDSEISSQSSSSKNETDAKNSAKQIKKISNSSQKSTSFSMMMMMMMMMITAIVVVEREISKALL